MAAEILFFLSAALIACTYLIYPAVTLIAAAVRRERETVNYDYLPTVTIIMPMHNEEKVISRKIMSLLALDYPHDRLEIILGSDASDDGTDVIAAGYAEHSDIIRFIRSDERRGKAGMLNMMAHGAHGDILIITDANVMPAPDTLRLMVRHFADSSTGICDAWPVTTSSGDQGITAQEKRYSSFEMRLKNSESRGWGSMTGPYGGFYAVRKALFPAIPEELLADDLFVGLSVTAGGYRAVNEDKAIVTEDIPAGIREQYHRRVRIATGSFQNLFYWGPLPGSPLSGTAWAFLIHKVVRWFSPILLTVCFMTTVILSDLSVYYFALALGQLIFLILPMLDFLLLKADITIKPLRYTTQFLMMNAALLTGLLKAINGVNKGIWEPTQRV